MAIDGSAALGAAMGDRENDPGYCLEQVWIWLGKPANPGYATAYAAYVATVAANPATLHSDTEPPAGAVVWFGVSPTRTDKNRSAGDVTLSEGGGMLRATDYPVNGTVGNCTIAQRAAQTQRPYLGWTDSFCGVPITVGSAATSETPTAPPEDDMPKLIRNYDGSIGLVTAEGLLQPISSMDEVGALKATGLVGDWVQMSDGLVWNLLTGRTARLASGVTAAQIAALVVPAILAGLQGAGTSAITQAQIEAAAETAIKTVLGKAAS